MGFPILSVIVYLPLVVAIVLLFLRSNEAIRRVATIGAAIDLVVSLVALGYYIYYKAGAPVGQSFDLQEQAVWLPAPLNINYHMGVDSVAILLVVLTTLLTLIAIAVSWEPIQKRVKEYYIMILFLEAGMLGVFCSLDFFLF